MGVLKGVQMPMGKSVKVVKIAFIGLLAVIVLIAGGGYGFYPFIIRRSQPQIDGGWSTTLGMPAKEISAWTGYPPCA